MQTNNVHSHEAFICPMSMSNPTTTFHPQTVQPLPVLPLPPTASEGRVVARGAALDAELAIDARLREMIRPEDDFVLVQAPEVLPGHQGKLLLLKNEGKTGRRFIDAVDPAKVPARVVLARLIESFSRLCSILLRLQDEGIAHIAICPDAVMFHSHTNSIRLGRFCHAVSVLTPGMGMGVGSTWRQGAYAHLQDGLANVAPELRLLLAITKTKKERVDADDVHTSIGKDNMGVFDDIVGQEHGIAVSRLEGQWRGWDVYALTRMYTELLESVCSLRDPTGLPSTRKLHNNWLDGVLTELRNGWTGMGPRPSLVKVKRCVEQAWYEGGDVHSCQQIVNDMESKRMRSLVLENGFGNSSGTDSA